VYQYHSIVVYQYNSIVVYQYNSIVVYQYNSIGVSQYNRRCIFSGGCWLGGKLLQLSETISPAGEREFASKAAKFTPCQPPPPMKMQRPHQLHSSHCPYPIPAFGCFYEGIPLSNNTSRMGTWVGGGGNRAATSHFVAIKMLPPFVAPKWPISACFSLHHRPPLHLEVVGKWVTGR